MALGPEGVFAAGTLSGSARLGGAEFSTEEEDAFVLSLTPDGTLLWAERYGQTGSVGSHDLAVSYTGDLLLVGSHGGSTTFGDIAVEGSESGRLFIATLDAGTGAATRVNSYGSAADSNSAREVIPTEGGGHVLRFVHRSAVDFGTLSSDSSSIYRTSLVAFGSDGMALWTWTPAGSVGSIASAAGGDVLALDARNRSELSRLGSGSETRWARQLASGGLDYGRQQVLGVDDGIVGFVRLSGTGEFGGEAVSARGLDMIVFRLEPTGEPVWVRQLGGTGSDLPGGLAVRPDGSLVLVAQVMGQVDFGGGPIGRALAGSVALAVLEADGSHRFSCAFPAPGAIPTDLVVDREDRLFIGGRFTGEVDFGTGLLTAGGVENGFIVSTRIP